jgi:imidazole glycerol-phosphate synthase subunit HisH
VRVAIVDYGMGNIRSITSALKYLGIDEVVISNKLDDIRSADKIILPGVGSFANAMDSIKKLNLDIILNEVVINDKKPILGICLGMQLMSRSSEEGGLTEGLSFIDSQVTQFSVGNLKVPHVGFNQVEFSNKSRLYEGLDNLSDFYFTHGYQMQSDKNISQSICEYGNRFIASYEVENMVGVQFHPELSQTNGLKILENFIKNF